MRRYVAVASFTLLLALGSIASIPVSALAQATSTPAQTQTAAKASDTGAIPTSGTAGATEKAYSSIMISIMSLFAWLVGVAAIVLDYAVFYTVTKAGAFQGADTTGAISAIGVAWRILRDIANIVLIFGFLAVGISTILDVGGYGFKKMIPKLLFVAIFINFSLLAAGTVITAGNLFATQFYTQINGGIPPGTKPPSLQGVANEGISARIMGQLGLPTIYEVDRNKEVFKAENMLLVGFLGIILFLVTAFVLFSLAIILIARFVILTFVIITAPIGFAGFAIPQLEGYAKQWWGTLIQQTITAPVLLLLLYVALAVITDKYFLTGFGASGNPSFLDFLTGTGINIGSFAGIMLSFFIAIGLLLAVTVIASRLSAFGADFATKWGSRLSFGVTTTSASFLTGGGARLLRRGVQRSRFANSTAARLAVSAFRPLEKASLDVRRIPGLRSGLALGGIEGASSFSYQSTVDTKNKITEAFDKSKKQYKDEVSEIEGMRTVQQIESEAKAGVLSAAMQKELAGMSAKDLQEMKGIKDGVNTLVQNLSPQQFEGLMKSEKLADSEKGKIKQARYKPLSDAIASGNADNVKKAVDKLSKGELEGMPPEMLDHALVLSKLSDKQRDTLTESKERTTAEKEKVRANSAMGKIKEVFDRAGGGAAGATAVLASGHFDTLTAPQIVKLDKGLLKEASIATQLAPAALAKLAEENKFTPAEMQAIGAIIRGAAGSRGHGYMSGPGGALWS